MRTQSVVDKDIALILSALAAVSWRRLAGKGKLMKHLVDWHFSDLGADGTGVSLSDMGDGVCVLEQHSAAGVQQLTLKVDAERLAGVLSPREAEAARAA